MSARDRHFLSMAARLAVRGLGGAEPNPTVGCVLVEPAGAVVGWGLHRRCGGPHAEIEALRRAGERARGAAAYVTLEPCNHAGRTGPCSEALVRAGVSSVIYARSDPTPEAGGGAASLRSSGLTVRQVPCADAWAVSAPFVHRVGTGRPWVVAKWAQTIDGRIATRTGDSRWISGVRSRRLVHRMRGRVDVVLTGIGTVIADDARLTARGVRRRRIARRVIVDPDLRLPESARVLEDLGEIPVTLACRAAAAETAEAETWRGRGVEVLAFETTTDIPLAELLRRLADTHATSTVLVEAGPGLLGRLWRERLVNEAWVFTSPTLLGDDSGLPPLRGVRVDRIAEATQLELAGLWRRGADTCARYLVTRPASGAGSDG